MDTTLCFSSTTASKKLITNNPYLIVYVVNTIVTCSHMILILQNPTWNEHFKIPFTHLALQVEFYIKDNDMFGVDLIKVATIPIKWIHASASRIEEEDGEKKRVSGSVRLRLYKFCMWTKHKMGCLNNCLVWLVSLLVGPWVSLLGHGLS